MAKINFTCPECGTHVLVEALLMREFWSLEEIYDGYVEHGELLDSEGSSLGGGDYFCNTCMYQIPANDADSLMEWLKEKDMLILGEDDVEDN